MSDVDDELLALAGGGSSPASRSSASLSASPSPPPRAKAKKRAAPKSKARKRRKADSDEEDEDEDAEGEEEALYPLEGIYRDEADRERLLDMPEIARETELAARREELSKRQQASALAALYRSQQAASGRGAPSGGAKKAKKPAPKKKPAKKARRKTSDDESSEEESDEDEEEEEEPESEYEEADRRKTGRLRKSIGASADKSAKLQELSRKRKARASGGNARDEAPGRRRGDRSSSEDSEDESEEEEEPRSSKVVGEGREAKRIAAKEPWTMPSRETLNRCRVTRDEVAKVLFKKGFEAAMIGAVVRVSRLDDRKRQIYRTYEVSRCKKGDNYYDLGDGRAFTSVEIWCTFGAETHGPFQLSQISNSAITEDEHSRYARVQEALWQTKKRHGPSDEAVQDAYDTWLAFVDRLVLDQAEALKMVRDRQENRAAFEKQQGERKAALPPPGAPPGPPPGAPPGSSARQGNASPVKGAYDGLMVADLNERNRKAEKERMAEVERRAALAKRAALGIAANAASRPGSGAATPANGASASGASASKSEHVRPVENAISQSAQDIDVDLGDF